MKVQLRTQFATEKAQLVIIAQDASDNTKKSITNSCKYYNVTYYICGTKDTIGHALGNSYNATVCVTDAGFGAKIESCLQLTTNGGE